MVREMKDKFIHGIIISLLSGLILGAIISLSIFDRYQISENGNTKIDKITGKAWRLDYSDDKSHLYGKILSKWYSSNKRQLTRQSSCICQACDLLHC